MTKPILLALVLSASALVQPAATAARLTSLTKVTGLPAKRLMHALELAGMSPMNTKALWTWTWTAKKMSCTAIETQDGLEDDVCEVDGKKLTGAAACVLTDAMDDAAMPGKIRGRVRGTVASSLTCVDDQRANGGADAMYVCSFR
jgi:hypothetical protein